MKAISSSVSPQYQSLSAVLQRAYAQAAFGKGADRHATAVPFESQSTQQICNLLGSHTGQLHQAIKKVVESQRLPRDRAVAELLGAINYLAGAVIYLERTSECAGIGEIVLKD